MARGTTLSSLMVLIGADTSGLEQGLSRGRTQLRAFQTSAVGSTATINRFRNGLVGLAASLGGLNPRLASLLSHLGAMTVGSLLTVGAIAAISKIKSEMDEAAESAKKWDDNLAGALDRLTELANKDVLGGKLGTFEDRIGALTRRGELRRDIADIGIRRQGIEANPFMLPGARSRRLGELDAELAPLAAELTNVQRAIDAADRALQGAIPQLEEFKVEVTSLATRVGNLATGFQHRGDLSAAGAASDAAFIRLQERQAFIGKLPKTTLTRITKNGPGGAASPTGIDDAFRSLGGGMEKVLKSTFSMASLSQLGASLMGNALGFVTGKLLDGLNSLLSGTDRLAEALDRNSRALGASTEAVTERLKSSGLSSFADEAMKALQTTADRFALGELAPLPGKGGDRLKLTLAEELAKVGLDMDRLLQIAQAVGITIPGKELLSIDILVQFLDQLNRAAGGLEDLTDAANRAAEALSNVPSGYRVERARYGASEVEMRHQAARGGLYTVPVNP